MFQNGTSTDPSGPNVADCGPQNIRRLCIHDLSTLVVQGLQIIWINVLLSGDNAVVIALACRDLDPSKRRWAIFGGSGLAVAMRIALTFFVVALLAVPFVKLASGALLLWIALDLLRHGDKARDVRAAGSTIAAIRTIFLADLVMSLDNIVAVAAAAKGSVALLVFGIALSVPLIVFGSTLVLSILERFPILVIAGAALLGWVAGEIVASDPFIEAHIGPVATTRIWFQIILAGLVLLFAFGLHFHRRSRRPAA